MVRIIVGIIVGWIVMAVVVMAVFGVTMMALGFDQILQPGSYWTTNAFNVIVLIGGSAAAVVGGVVCALIARNSRATLILAALVLVMGLVSAVMNMNKPDPPARSGPPTLQDISTHGKEPTWFAFSKTIIAPIGVIIGAQLIQKRTTIA